MEVTTKTRSQLYTRGASIDANYGPWESIDEYMDFIHSSGLEKPYDGTTIAVKKTFTDKISKYIYEGGKWRLDDVSDLKDDYEQTLRPEVVSLIQTQQRLNEESEAATKESIDATKESREATGKANAAAVSANSAAMRANASADNADEKAGLVQDNINLNTQRVNEAVQVSAEAKSAAESAEQTSQSAVATSGNAKEIAERAENIAKGRATGYVFDTLADMKAWIAVDENKSRLNLGDNLYIKDVNVPDYWWDGTSAQELETEHPDLTDYVKNTDYANANNGGVVKVAGGGSGVAIDGNHRLYIVNATNAMINAKSSTGNPITPKGLDYAVKVGMTTNTIELTAAEKAAAQRWFGITPITVSEYEALADKSGINYVIPD